MKNSLMTGGMLLGTIFFLFVTLAVAEDIEVDMLTEFTYGKVVSISENTLVLQEFDFDTEENVQVTYVLNTETQYLDFESYKDIQIGDDIDVHYINVDGEKVVTQINKEVDWDVEDTSFYRKPADFDIIKSQRMTFD